MISEEFRYGIIPASLNRGITSFFELHLPSSRNNSEVCLQVINKLYYFFSVADLDLVALCVL